MAKEQVEVDAAELKRQRKAAKKAQAEAEAAEEEEELAEAKRKRKAAKKAAAEAAAAEEVPEEDPAEAKKKRKAAKKAAEAAAAEAEEEVEEAPAKKKAKVADAEPAKVESGEPFKLFIGGIAWSVSEDVLRKDFEECGEVLDMKLLMDAESGYSKGIAFITMVDQAGFDAVMKYNGEQYAGRPLNIAKANSNGVNKGKGDGKGKGKGGKDLGEKPPGCKSVVVKALSYDVNEADLQKCFEKCAGGPTNVRILYDKETGNSRGLAFLDFHTSDAVDEAMKLSETELKGRKFFMRYCGRD